jgi:hypothetical protein
MGSNFYFFGISRFCPKMAKGRVYWFILTGHILFDKNASVSFVGCILLTKSLLCNIVVINRDAVYFRIFKVFQKSYFKCSRKILCRFQLREVGSHVSVRMVQSCVWTPISVKKLRIVQVCIHPDVMATRSDTFQSSRRFQLYSTDELGR